MTNVGMASAARPLEDVDVGRLILDAIPADFDPRSDVAIAPWCFLDREDVYPEWEDLPFTDVGIDHDDRARTGANLCRLANFLLPTWRRRLEDAHGLAHDEEYWRILLMPWLVFMCQAMWKRYQIVEAMVRRHQDRPYVVEIAEDVEHWDALDLADIHHRVLVSPQFNFWLTSRIVEALEPSSWSLRRVDLPPIAPPVRRTPDRGFRAWGRRLFSGLRCRQVPGVRWIAFPLSIFLTLLPNKPRRTPPRQAPTQKEMSEAFPAPFLTLLEALLPRLLPRVLSDDFRDHEAAAARRTYRPGRTNLVGPVLILNEDDKFILAHAAEAGERIVCGQHGGGSCHKVNGTGVEIEYLQDAYLSWGWQARENYVGHILPVPSPMYSPYGEGHRATTDRLIFVAGEERIHAHRIETGHEPAQAVAARRKRLKFLDRLPGHLRGALYYRPYPEGQGVLPDATHMRTHYPDMKILDGPLPPHLMACRLLVIDHPTTTFGLAMAANVPTIAYLQPDVWALSAQADPHFKRFRDAGFVFDNPQAAAAKAAEVWDDVEAWWAQPDIQAARLAFKHEYARTSRVWWWHWMKTLWRL